MRPHFHGTPIWGNAGDVLRVAVSGSGAFVSYVRPDQIERCFKYADMGKTWFNYIDVQF